VREKPFSYFPGKSLAVVNMAVKARLKNSPGNDSRRKSAKLTADAGGSQSVESGARLRWDAVVGWAGGRRAASINPHYSARERSTGALRVTHCDNSREAARAVIFPTPFWGAPIRKIHVT
jgi:hypothetical protein